MSASVENEPKHQQHRCASDGGLLSSVDANTSTLLRKRRSDVALGFSSYNSAFLEDIFGDIASSDACPHSTEAERQGEATTTVQPSDNSVVKRRRVSTNKSLGRSCRSLKNVRSFSTVGLTASTKHRASSVMMIPSQEQTTKDRPTKKDLPATVSASYSFQLDLTASDHQEDKQAYEKEAGQYDDFGWFVDMDSGHDHQDNYGSQATLSPSTPLGFSAPIAPRADPTRNHQAEAEWAQAADTVDEVLGDLF